MDIVENLMSEFEILLPEYNWSGTPFSCEEKNFFSRTYPHPLKLVLPNNPMQ